MDNKIKLLLNALGGAANIQQVTHCMTRLRIEVKQSAPVDQQSIEKLELFIAIIVDGNNLQLVAKPGQAERYAEQLQLQITAVNHTTDNRLQLRKPLQFITAIFTPLLPALIGCGFITGTVNVVKVTWPLFYQQQQNLFLLLSLASQALLFYLPVMLGYSIALRRGTSTTLAALVAGMLSLPDLNKLHLLNQPLQAGSGGIFSVIVVVLFMSGLEKILRRKLKTPLAIMIIPVLTIVTTLFAALIVFQPVGAWVSTALQTMLGTLLFANTLMAVVVGALLGAVFLGLVLTGLHHSLLLIHMEIFQLSGQNHLYPILAMAGMGQVGACLWVLCKTQNRALRQILLSGLPIGLLGIGEPLLFGVSLPLGKPFIAGCIGGAAGGGLLAALHTGIMVPFATTGLTLVPLVNAGQRFDYLSGVLLAITVGFIASMLLGFADPKEK